MTLAAPPVRRLSAESAVGPAVVLVHGMEDSWRTWLPLVRRLDPAWRVYAVEPPWSAGAGYRWRRLASPGQWLGAALREFPIQCDVLVGHSLGANAVLECLSSAPVPAPGAAMLMAPFYCPPELDITWRVFERARLAFEQIVREGLELRLGSRLDRLEPALVEAMLAKMVERIGPAGFTALFDQFLATRELGLAAVTMPVLVVAGGRDPTLDRHRAAALRRDLPGADVVVEPGFDHFCQVRQVDAVARHLTGFVNATSMTSGGIR